MLMKQSGLVWCNGTGNKIKTVKNMECQYFSLEGAGFQHPTEITSLDQS